MITVAQAYNSKVPIATYAGRIDPSRTTSLRNAFARDMAGRFSQLAASVQRKVVDEDCFGLRGKVAINAEGTIARATFAFPRSADKVQAFGTWMQGQMEKDILQVSHISQIGSGVEAAWTNKYISDSYKRGVIRAHYELEKAGYAIPKLEEMGGVELAMMSPFHIDRVGLLYSRVYSDLKGITAAMDTNISRILAQGMADGDGPRLLAQKIRFAINGEGPDKLGLTDTLGRFIPGSRRAQMLARTEIIRAHHVATIQEYRNYGVAGVNVQAEWKTAGDMRVCDVCSSMEGQTFTLDQIEKMIPAHPMCRCVALPILAPEKTGLGVPSQPPTVVPSMAPEDIGKYLAESGYRVSLDGHVISNDVLETSDSVVVKALTRRYNEIVKFNLPELNADLDRIMQDVGLVISSRRVYIKDDYVKFVWESNKTAGGDVIKLVRTFMKNKTVEHSLFDIPAEYQGKGLAKRTFQALYKQYQKGGIMKVDVHANINVGGYAWAKYGFEARVSEVMSLISSQVRPKSEINDVLRVVKKYVASHNLSPSSYMPVSVIADLPMGKNFLLGSSWHGRLDLTNPIQRERFESYIKK